MSVPFKERKGITKTITKITLPFYFTYMTSDEVIDNNNPRNNYIKEENDPLKENTKTITLMSESNLISKDYIYTTRWHHSIHVQSRIQVHIPIISWLY